MEQYARVAGELGIRAAQAEAVGRLLDEGATIPFIARYRKEAHGALDEVAIVAVRDRLGQLRELEDRRAAVLKSLRERDLLTETLAADIAAAATMTALEDAYLPYRPKRRTRASMAREKGLEPLALRLLEQTPGLDPARVAEEFVNAERGVDSADLALAGARDIIAEMAAEDPTARARLREFFARMAIVSSVVAKGKSEEGAKFRDYFDWQEAASKAAGHRLLAMLRGEKEGVLNVHFLPDPEEGRSRFCRLFVRNDSPSGQEVRQAVEDAYGRLLAPSLETELRGSLREKAETEGIAVFAANLRQLLLAAPLGQKRVLALDPGLRTGCKVVCLDAQGKLLAHSLIHILTPEQRKAAGEHILGLCKQYAIEALAVGNGTGGRETEQLLRDLKPGIPVIMVSESGASVYSASEAGRREFPDLDLTVRGAVSIGRRLMDPLAELVKIDPKAIGVGQYQHDVDQTRLKQSLTDEVISCVNAVGVELNTASPELLAFVSGLGPGLATAIVAYREANGPFVRRRDLLKVPRLGPKAFELCAGFLRIHGGEHPLDASAVHPESYAVVEAMARDVGCTVADLLDKAELRRRIRPETYVDGRIGLPTLTDILAELEKPGRDPREQFEAMSFSEHITSLEQLEPGMRLPGLVTNVTNFGAFVDIGVHQDGLVHISEMADEYVSNPHTLLKVQQRVQVIVLSVDTARRRISLSLRGAGFEKAHGADRAQAHTPGREGARAPGGSGDGRKGRNHDGRPERKR